MMPLLKTLAVGAVCIALAGCISLFPKSKPAQMYRFGVMDVAASPAPGAVTLSRGPISFPRAASGDRILTATGTETAYIAEARWVSPAEILFGDAVERAFDARAGGPRLVTRGDLISSDRLLRIDVDTFETRYLNGPETAPTVVVSMRVDIVRPRDRQVMAERVISISKPATSNRVGAIVDAYDSAVREALGQLAEWAAGNMG
jgi:cholesterol transport system auxiliary component